MVPPWGSYLICATPRSGSTLLAQLLASTGLAGTPIEYFHEERMATLRDEWGTVSLDEYRRVGRPLPGRVTAAPRTRPAHFAKSTVRLSRITVTLIWPGYSSSRSMSRA